MGLYESQKYKDNLQLIVQQHSWLRDFAGKTIFITGGTGLIGSALVDVLLALNEHLSSKVHLLIASRDEETVLKRFYYYRDCSELQFVQYDATKHNDLSFQADYIIHAASNAYPAMIQQQPVETMLSNFSGLYELLHYAVQHSIKNTVFISSSEVYGLVEGNLPLKEEDYGYVDLLNPRSSYPVSKRAAETLCVSFAKEYHLNVSIVRPGHIYGPTAMREDNRVSSIFPYQVLAGENIVMKSDGSQMRSYCHSLDCATAILKVLLSGRSAEAYNISNSDSIMSIREMASLFAKHGDVEVIMELPTDVERNAFNPMVNSSLNSDKLIALGWKGLFDKEKGTRDTLTVLRESNKSI